MVIVYSKLKLLPLFHFKCFCQKFFYCKLQSFLNNLTLIKIHLLKHIFHILLLKLRCCFMFIIQLKRVFHLKQINICLFVWYTILKATYTENHIFNEIIAETSHITYLYILFHYYELKCAKPSWKYYLKYKIASIN